MAASPLTQIGATANRFSLKPEQIHTILQTNGSQYLPSKETFEMANGFDPRATAAPRSTTVGRESAAVDAGLRSYMLSVYNYMTSGVLLTGIVALLFANSGYAAQILGGPGILKYIIMFAPLAFVMVLSFGINRLSTGTAQLLFWAFATVMGLSMASIFLVFTGTSIAQTFFAVAAAFAGLSLYGYTTKKDLSGFGTFLIMGVIGLLVAMVINIFLQSSAMQLAISFIGVLLFAGLTAYDTQRIKSLYFQVAGTDMMGKTVIMGALSLYLDFVNMFTFLLNFMGSRE
jgi:FtsH-binding integral membrane protein